VQTTALAILPEYDIFGLKIPDRWRELLVAGDAAASLHICFRLAQVISAGTGGGRYISGPVGAERQYGRPICAYSNVTHSFLRETAGPVRKGISAPPLRVMLSAIGVKVLRGV